MLDLDCCVVSLGCLEYEVLWYFDLRLLANSLAMAGVQPRRGSRGAFFVAASGALLPLLPRITSMLSKHKEGATPLAMICSL